MKKTIVKIIVAAIVMIGVFMAGATLNATEKEYNIEDYEKEITDPTYYVKDDDLLIIDTNDYTKDEVFDLIASRNGKLVIVVEHGTVVSEKGDGQGNLGYIKYDADLAVGTKVKTYFTYNPETNYEDDIVERYDFIQ